MIMAVVYNYKAHKITKPDTFVSGFRTRGFSNIKTLYGRFTNFIRFIVFESRFFKEGEQILQAFFATSILNLLHAKS